MGSASLASKFQILYSIWMSKRAFYLALAAVTLFALVGLYTYTQRPSRVVSNAISKLGQAETQHFRAEIALDQTPAAQALLKEATNLTITLDGSFDRKGAERAAEGEPRQGRDSLVTHIAVNAKSDSVSLDINGELRLIGDKAYLLVKTAPAAVPVLAALKDKWVELPRGGQVAAAVAAPQHPLFQEVKRLGREQVDGRSAVKYETIATEQGVVSLMNNIAGMLGTELTDDQLGQLRGNLSGIQNLPITLWISPVQHELLKLEAALPNSGVRYTLTFSDRNQSVDHTVPEGAKPVSEVLKPQ